MNIIKLFISIILNNGTSVRFISAIIIGIAFSLAVILGTIGIMDGFENTLKLSLRRGHGDLIISRGSGMVMNRLIIEEKLKEVLNTSPKKAFTYSGLYTIPGLVVSEKVAKGIVIQAVDLSSINEVVDLSLDFGEKNNGLAIGVELAKELKVGVGDILRLIIGQEGSEHEFSPTIHEFLVSSLVKHGIYQKDAKLIYMPYDLAKEAMGLNNEVNATIIKLDESLMSHQSSTLFMKDYEKSLEVMKEHLEKHLGKFYHVKEYWFEYSSLLKAVVYEKLTLSLILQLIVLISVVNLVGMTYYLREKFVKEIFLIQSLGTSQADLVRALSGLYLVIWFFSCALAILLINIFNWALSSSGLLSIPKDIYNLDHLSIELSWNNYGLVFFLALMWIFVATFFSLKKMLKRAPIEGLRKGFA